ncbi:MAG: glycosyltransferase, partial [Parafilimonas sp.]
NSHYNIYPFPSSIDKEHFEKARNNLLEPEDQKEIPHPRLGFYGVVDERFNIELLKEVSAAEPQWHFIIVGPFAKIDAETLPAGNNIHYLGSKSYNELPQYLSGWDVAIMPFALNESTKYISPTKTPEYLAGGKPVISASIKDVVEPYGNNGYVYIADNAEEFIAAANIALHNKDDNNWLQKVDAFLANISWDKTWNNMRLIIEKSLTKKFEITEQKKIKEYV